MTFVKSISRSNVMRFVNRIKLLLVLFVLMLILLFVNKEFYNVFNIRSILNLSSILGFIVIGESLVILTKGIDLSVGKIASLSTVVLSAFMIYFQNYFNGPLVIIISVFLTICVAGLMGSFSGIFVTKFKIAPLISTLIVLWLATGFAGYIQKGRTTEIVIESFNIIGKGSVFNIIPYSTIALLIILLVFYFILNKTSLGKYIYAVGGNEYAAYLSGIKTDRIKILVYILAAVLSAIAGLFLAAYTGYGFPRAADGYEFTAITAAVMGGIALAGGKGNIVNTVLAILILELIYKFLFYIGLSPYIHGVIVGLILLSTVYFNVSRNK